MTSSADHPYPPLELASRVFCLQGWSDPLRAYEELGAQTKTALTGLLPDGWSFEGRRVLDFGCGAGRTLRHFLSEAQTAEFWGADIDAPSIDWLGKALCPPLHAWRCSAGPPLGLQHGSFDLIWAISVFTHLTDTSLPWLLELHRLLKPDGLLIATYMGRWNSEFFAGEPWDEARVGKNVLGHFQDWDFGGPAVLMSDWWVRAHWGRAFEIVEIAPQIQNMGWALLRRRDVELTTEDLEKPEDDPREYLALRHNLRQTQRELFDVIQRFEATERQHAVACDALRREYEESLSWRLTRPLRQLNAARRARRPRRA
jgi:SAM-dependent methyltransferase